MAHGSAEESFDNQVRLAVYRFFVDEARAPSAPEVADSLGVSAVDVESSFRRLHEAHVLVLAPGTSYIWMANPFSALPTTHQVHVGDRTYWGNCIWDALGIVALSEASTGVVHTRCADCADELEIVVEEGRLVSSTGLVHYAVPAARWWEDIGFT